MQADYYLPLALILLIQIITSLNTLNADRLLLKIALIIT